MEDKIILGLTEDITIHGDTAKETAKARIDTGAVTSSINKEIVNKMKLGPVVKTTTVITSQGSEKRPSIIIKTNIRGRIIKERFTVTDRSHMRYPILIGQNILKQGFLINPSKE